MREITILYDPDDKELKSLSIAQLEDECDICGKKMVAVARADDGNIWRFCQRHWVDFCNG